MSTTEPQDPHGVLEDVSTAMTKFYTVLCTMPHMEPTCLRVPTAQGWASINTEALTASGTSDPAIELLRQLPCLAPSLGAEKVWMVSTDRHQLVTR